MDDDALLALMRSMAGADWPAVEGTIRARPALATAALERGATRQEPTEFFLDAIGHHVYLGDTALHVAAAAYHASTVVRLVDLGADVEARNRRGARPLHYAVDGGPSSPRWDPVAQREAVLALLAHGADVDAADRNGTTPLLRAVRNRCAAAVEALLEGGADPTIANTKGSTAAQLARVTSGRGGTGTPEAKREQAAIIRLLDAAGREPGWLSERSAAGDADALG